MRNLPNPITFPSLTAHTSLLLSSYHVTHVLKDDHPIAELGHNDIKLRKQRSRCRSSGEGVELTMVQHNDHVAGGLVGCHLHDIQGGRHITGPMDWQH